jgi:YVTN family beta-propeller protein
MRVLCSALLLRLAFSVVLTSQCAVAQTVIATVPTGSTPVALAVNSTTNKIYAVNRNSNNVTAIDGATNSTTTLGAGSHPSAVAVNSVTNKIYVTNYCGNDPNCQSNGTVTVIDGATLSTVTVAVGFSQIPNGLPAAAVNSVTNKIYVTNYCGNDPSCQSNGTMTVIDGASNSILTNVAVGKYPFAVGVNPMTNKIYIANSGDGTVTVVDGQFNSVAATIKSVGSFPYAVTVNSLTNKIYVANYVREGTVSVIDGKSDSVIANVAVGVCPAAVGLNPVTNKIYTANYGDGTVTAIDGISNTTETVSLGTSPGALAVNPVTNKIYVTSYLWQGSVAAIDGVNNSIVTVRVGSYPDAVAVDGLSNRVYVANSSDGTVSVIAGANSDPLQFIPVTPCRVADTRRPNGPFGGPPIGADTSRDFAIPASACQVPSTAAAYSLNVTVVPDGPLGYLTVWPTGQDRPGVSTLNSLDGRIKADAAIVPAGAAGAVSVFATSTTNVILDINGYFAPVTLSTLAFYPLQPCRVADTRRSNGPLGGPFLKGGAPGRDFPITSSGCIPAKAGALAYSLNFTAVPKGPLGYLTTWPAGQNQPGVSTLNALTGTITANAAIVQAGSGGDIDVFVSNDSDVVIDINGYFASAPQGGLSLYATAPCRAVDTRKTTGLFSGTIAANVVGSPCGLASVAQAFVLNATVVPPGGLGYLTLWADGQTRPGVSTLNAIDGAITSNMAIVPTTNGLIDAFASNPTQLILDSSSYFGP